MEAQREPGADGQQPGAAAERRQGLLERQAGDVGDHDPAPFGYASW